MAVPTPLRVLVLVSVTSMIEVCCTVTVVLDTESNEIVIVVGTVMAIVIVSSDVVGAWRAPPSLLRTILEDVTVAVVVRVDSKESVVVIVTAPEVNTAT